MDFTQLKSLVNNSDNIVFFGGAGVSTESSIPDFRSNKGLFQTKTETYSPEEILSHSFLESNLELFFKFYKGNMIYPDVMAVS